MRRLDGKVLLVAGGGSIGGGIARRFAEEGASVVLGDVDMDSAAEIIEDIRSKGGTAVATKLDGADEESVNAAVALACETYGGLDGMHANFAYFGDHSLDVTVLDIPLETFDAVMNVNTRGFLLCTRAALPKILERGGGSIVFTSSAAAYIGEIGRVAYGMSKAAGHALMRHVASRFGPQNVRCNVIAPGQIRNVKWSAEITAAQAASADYRHIKRPGTPLDIAALSALLMSDEGSFITAQVLNVDGGRTMRA